MLPIGSDMIFFITLLPSCASSLPGNVLESETVRTVKYKQYKPYTYL